MAPVTRVQSVSADAHKEQYVTISGNLETSD